MTDFPKDYQSKIEERVYHIKDYLSILKDMLDKIVYETVHMSDEELKYDRGRFVSMTDMVLDKDKDGFYDKDLHLQTLCVELEQYRRFGKILYSRDKEVEEQNGHEIDKDFFDERELDTDAYTKYKKH
jgi:hypothetical protein